MIQLLFHISNCISSSRHPQSLQIAFLCTTRPVHLTDWLGSSYHEPEITIRQSSIFMLAANTDTVALHSFPIFRFAWRPLASILHVLVMPTKPWPRFVSPIRCPVEPLVHPPERVEAACVGGVSVVDDTVGECECAHARRLASVGGDISAGHSRKIAWVETRSNPVLTTF